MDVEELERRLDGFRELMEEVEGTLEGYTTILCPYWDEKAELETRIRRTHSRRSDNCLIFRPEGAKARFLHFANLLELAIVWGSDKTEYNQLKAQLRGYEREAEKIKTELRRLAKRKSRDDKQGEMF